MIQTKKHANVRETDARKAVLSNALSGGAGVVCGFLASLASLPFGLLPFGVAFASVAADSVFTTIGLVVGACLGYLVQGVGAFVYLAGVLLSIPMRKVLSFLFRRVGKTLINTITTALCLIFCHALLAGIYGFLTFDILTGLLSIAAGTVFCYFANITVVATTKKEIRASGLTQLESLALIVTVCILLLPLGQLSIYGITPARIVGAFLVLCCGVYGGAALGGMAGAMAGTILSFVAEGTTHIIAAYAVAGILAGLVGRRGKLRGVCIFMAGCAAITLYLDSSLLALATLCEASLACGVYVLLPEKWSDALSRLLMLKNTAVESAQSDRLCQYVGDRLAVTAVNLDEISRSLAPRDVPTDVTDLQSEINRTVNKTCRSCSKSTACWTSGYNDSMRALSGAMSILRKRPLEREDLPRHFIDRCKHSDKLIEQFNLSAGTYREVKKQEYTAEKNKTVMAAQYASLSQFIEQLSDQLSAPLRFDEVLHGRVQQYFIDRGAHATRLLVYHDAQEALYIDADLNTKTAPNDRKTVTDLSDLCGVRLTVLECTAKKGGFHLILGKRAVYTLDIACQSLAKKGETLCGDCWTQFRTQTYAHTLCLADGMGSGAEANRHAELTCEILESIMKSGFSAEKALRLLNTTLLLSTNAQRFSTVDLVDFNLFTGRADFYKLGAASTHIIRAGRAYEIPCASLPVGIMGSTLPTHRFCTLKDGDMILLHSDGVELTGDMVLTCARESDGDLDQLCAKILHRLSLGDADDDMTLAIIKVRNR